MKKMNSKKVKKSLSLGLSALSVLPTLGATVLVGDLVSLSVEAGAPREGDNMPGTVFFQQAGKCYKYGPFKVMRNNVLCLDREDEKGINHYIHDGVLEIPTKALINGEWCELNLDSIFRRLRKLPIKMLKFAGKIDATNKYVVDDGVVYEKLENGKLKMVFYPFQKECSKYKLLAETVAIDDDIFYDKEYFKHEHLKLLDVTDISKDNLEHILHSIESPTLELSVVDYSGSDIEWQDPYYGKAKFYSADSKELLMTQIVYFNWKYDTKCKFYNIGQDGNMSKWRDLDNCVHNEEEILVQNSSDFFLVDDEGN